MRNGVFQPCTQLQPLQYLVVVILNRIILFIHSYLYPLVVVNHCEVHLMCECIQEPEDLTRITEIVDWTAAGCWCHKAMFTWYEIMLLMFMEAGDSLYLDGFDCFFACSQSSLRQHAHCAGVSMAFACGYGLTCPSNALQVLYRGNSKLCAKVPQFACLTSVPSAADLTKYML